MRRALFCFLCGRKDGWRGDGRGGEMVIENVLLGGDGWGCKERGGELRLRSWKCSL